MRALLFGATGMVGQGVLRECLLDPDVTSVLAVGRSVTGLRHPKLREIRHADLFDLAPIEHELADRDACFFCAGMSSAGLGEQEYRRITYDLTLSVARTLLGLNPGMTFEYVSGLGTDGTERGRVMWARVKGATENALLALPFAGVYMLRPGYIQPLHGIRSRTWLYRTFYATLAPFAPLLRRFPAVATTTEQLGRAMIQLAKAGGGKRVLDTQAINAVGRS